MSDMSGTTIDPSPRRQGISSIIGQRFASLFKRKSEASHADSIEATHDHMSDAIARKISQFSKLEAVDIMINRTDIIAASQSMTFEELKKLFVVEGHSRIPIFKNGLDDILGFIHIKDLFKVDIAGGDAVDVRSLVRDIIFIPESIKLPDLLTKMRASQIHIAIVLDEHSGTSGLVTIEDIVEELVGEIQDEHDTSSSEQLIVRSGNDFVIDTSVPLVEVERELGVQLREELEEVEYNTLGGFIITRLGFIPKVGYRFSITEELGLEVLEASTRRVKKVKISQIIA